jgi:curved DNA-binding protein CbpA
MDHYKVLEVNNTASKDDIRKSFRYLALRYHPDRNNNSEESKRKFMLIVEAYKVLSDEQARKKYDIVAAVTNDNTDANKHNYVHYNSCSYNPLRQGRISSNSNQMYSYADIKRKYIQNPVYDISMDTITNSFNHIK